MVTNTGNVPLTGVTVTDSGFTGTGTLSPTTCPAGASTLAVGAQVTCTATYTLTQADVNAGSLSNSATATGTTPNGPPITTPPSNVQIPFPPAPSIALVKTATPTTANAAGDTVAYSFRVTNTGNVTLTNPVVTETAFSGTGTPPLVTCPTGSFLPGQSLTCTASYTVAQADVNAGSVTNTATATATPPTGAAPVSSPSTAVVTIAPAAALTVAKTASIAGPGVVGDVVRLLVPGHEHRQCHSHQRGGDRGELHRHRHPRGGHLPGGSRFPCTWRLGDVYCQLHADSGGCGQWLCQQHRHRHRDASDWTPARVAALDEHPAAEPGSRL